MHRCFPHPVNRLGPRCRQLCSENTQEENCENLQQRDLTVGMQNAVSFPLAGTRPNSKQDYLQKVFKFICFFSGQKTKIIPIH